jgi:hypothetical protein
LRSSGPRALLRLTQGWDGLRRWSLSVWRSNHSSTRAHEGHGVHRSSVRLLMLLLLLLLLLGRH